MPLATVILAAGEGKRMKSRTSKVLHHVAGCPLVHYPLRAAVELGSDEVVLVVNPGNSQPVLEYVAKAFEALPVKAAVQAVARGTGDAARIGLSVVSQDASEVLILSGDTPLITAADLSSLLESQRRSALALALLTAVIDAPTGYGRVLRDAAGRLLEIREERDLKTDAERCTKEVNAGVYLAERSFLEKALERLDDDNAQGEFYLTDIVAQAASDGRAMAIPGDPSTLLGVNDRSQLHQVESALYARIREAHRMAGVTIHGEPLIDTFVTIEPDAVIGAGVHLRGTTQVRARAMLDVGSVVSDSEIGEDTVIKPYSVIASSSVGPRVQVGPFAHVRPDSQIDADARVGNFVEIKKTRLRQGAKANHLAYLGDGDVGARSNIGAGTIFCNYDGFTKSTTVIDEDVFIGSDSQIIAPVHIGKGAYVATGTSVTEDVPAQGLAISRGRQIVKPDYAPKLREKLGKGKRR